MQAETTQPITPDEVRLWARHYASNMKGLPRILCLCRPFIFPFERLVNAVPDRSTVFDVGCGTGLFLYLLHKSGKIGSGTGVDLSATAVASANEAHKNEATNITLLCCGETEKWPIDLFDVVSAIDVLHHVPRSLQKSFFQSLCAKVTPGGLLLYKDMAARPWRVNWGNRLHDLLIARQWINYIKPEQAVDWAEESGLDSFKRDYADYVVYGHDFLFFRKKTR